MIRSGALGLLASILGDEFYWLHVHLPGVISWRIYNQSYGDIIL